MKGRKKSIEDFWKRNRKHIVMAFIILLGIMLSLSIFGIIFTITRRHELSDIDVIANLVIYTGNAIVMSILLFATFRFRIRGI